MEELKIVRKQKELTQIELAKLVNILPATLSDTENGIRVPHKKTKIKIEAILGPIDWWKTLLKGPDHLIAEGLQTLIRPNKMYGKARIRHAKQILKHMEQNTN